jgi:hypothetical protein
MCKNCLVDKPPRTHHCASEYDKTIREFIDSKSSYSCNCFSNADESLSIRKIDDHSGLISTTKPTSADCFKEVI